MPRRPAWTGTHVFHVMNRAARRLRLFDEDRDYQLFLICLSYGLDEVPVRLLAYCVMPNHFHLVVWPTESGQLGRFMQSVTATHSQRWHRARGSVGTGCVYQGRYRAVPVQQDEHFLKACRYVERNALRAKLVRRAEDWPWSSLSQRCRNSSAPLLTPWPIPQPANWLALMNESEPDRDVDAVRLATERGVGFGSEAWQKVTPGALRPRGRPRSQKGVGTLFT